MSGAPESVLDELKRYVGFTEADARVLSDARPLVAPAFTPIVDAFYDAIERNPGAAAAIHGGDEQVVRLKRTLEDWLGSVFGGVYDDAYLERRSRIGRVHVRIGLDQRYMFGAMNVVRTRAHEALREATVGAGWEPARREAAHAAFDRVCDLELAIMLETYRETYLRRVRDNERLATLGQLAATIGHELRNPLAVIDTSIHLLRRRLSDDDKSVRHLQRIVDQTALSNGIIADLLELARDREPEREPTDVGALLEQALDVLPGLEGVVVALDVPTDLPRARVDAGQIRQLVVNLVSNAVQASQQTRTPEPVRVTVGVEAPDALVIEVADRGPGLTREVERRLFEPLFTTRSRGIGLGLALCKRIVEKHRGTIEGVNREGGGARFRVVLPLALEVSRGDAPSPGGG